MNRSVAVLVLTTCGRNQVSRPFIGEKLERGTEIDVSQSRSEGRACWPQWAWDDEANLCNSWSDGVLKASRGKVIARTAWWGAALSLGMGV